MTLKDSVMLVASQNIQHLRTFAHGEVLRQFGTLSTEVVITTSEKLNSIIFGLGA